jgi:sugar phosphate isomerase/epimerase
MIDRRSFLASGVAAATSLSLAAKSLKNVGAQLYTLRTVLPKEPLATLQALETAGFTEAEVIGGQMNIVWDSLMKTKIKPISLHLDTLMFTTKQDELGPALDDAAKKGFRYVVCPYIAPKDRGGADVIKRLGETLNKAAAKCKAAGQMLCYHNHAFEFAPAGDGTLLDVLMAATDPKLVGLEFDIMWSQLAGVDPISVLKKYKGRVPLMHLKDLEKGTAQRFDEKVERSAFKEVGNGSLDFKTILATAAKTGVKHYFVEQDQTPGAPLDSMKQSMDYLRKLRF